MRKHSRNAVVSPVLSHTRPVLATLVGTNARGTVGLRAAIYERVSTDSQTEKNQEPQLREWAQRLGCELVKVYVDKISGAKKNRPQLNEVVAGAHRRDFDVVLIWALDRLSREGVEGTLKCLRRFEHTGVR